MQQLLSYVSSGKLESKASSDGPLLKMMDAASKNKVKDSHDREKTDDTGNTDNNVPFIQVLSQQIKSFFQSEKSSQSAKGVKSDLKDLQKDLAKLTQMNAEQSSPDKTTEELLGKINALLNGSIENGSDEKFNEMLSDIINQSGSESISDLEKILAKLNLSLDDGNITSDKTAAKGNNLLQQLAKAETTSQMGNDKNVKLNIADSLAVGENVNNLKTFMERGKFNDSEEEFKNTFMSSQNNKAALNTSKIENIQNLLNDIADKYNSTLKEKIDTQVPDTEEISLISVGSANSGNKSEAINSTSAEDIVSQVAREIKQSLAGDGGRIKVTLNPPSLGAVDMDVMVRNNRVQITLVADNKDVQQTLNNHIDQLKGSLQTQGLTIDRCDVLMQNKHDEFYRSFNNQSYYQGGSGQGNNERNHEEDNKKASTGNSITINQQSVSRINSDAISLFA